MEKRARALGDGGASRDHIVDEHHSATAHVATYEPFSVPHAMPYRIVLNSDDEAFGGTSAPGPSVFTPVAGEWQEQAQSITLTLPPLGVLFLKPAPPALPQSAPSPPVLVPPVPAPAKPKRAPRKKT